MTNITAITIIDATANTGVSHFVVGENGVVQIETSLCDELFARIIFKDRSTLVFYGMPFKYKTAEDPEEAPF